MIAVFNTFDTLASCLRSYSLHRLGSNNHRKRERINAALRETLDEATDKWGVKVTRVEVKEIEPPRDISEAMSKQMKAEKEKRATILEAEAYREKQILEAEGDKQNSILVAGALLGLTRA